MTFLTCERNEDVRKISQLRIKPEDVLENERDRILRMACLLKAATLESFRPTPITLSIEGAKYCQKINSRIIAAGDDHVLLESGVSIPVKCIHKIEF